MTDLSRACTRCGDPAEVIKGSAAYCLSCSEMAAWSEVIRVVQDAIEPAGFQPVGSGAVGSESSGSGPVGSESPGSESPGSESPGSESLGSGVGDEADPFARRLA